MQLKKIAESIWTFEGSCVHFFGFPFPTRMCVIRLANGDLWVHSPEKLNNHLIDELSALGKVAYLISPNKLHHLFLDEWIEAFPSAKNYAAPGLIRKRSDLHFDKELGDQAEAAWIDEIDQVMFRGSPLMEEAVFFHKASSTLILTDLIENFDPDTLNLWQKALAGFAGILAPKGKTPIDWRLSFLLGSRKQARVALNKMHGWKPEKIILSHGQCIFDNATVFLAESFSWLKQD